MNLPVPEESVTLSERRRLQAKARRLAKRAESLADAGRVDEAIACQSEVAALRPDDPAAFLRLGLLLREAHRIDPAVSALRHALLLSPATRDPREALIATLLDGGRFEEIVSEAKALVKVAPRSLFARDVLSIAYLQLGKHEKALRVVGELIWLDSLNPDHYLKRAMLFQQQNNIRAAVSEYIRVMNMAPEDSDAFACAEDALETLDEDQLRQIVLLASEDRLFHWKLCRETADAAQERGFFLTAEGVARLRHLAQSHLSDLERDLTSSTTWGRVRFYN
jgi:tetratricopeptide (TPR) repeat protein